MPNSPGGTLAPVEQTTASVQPASALSGHPESLTRAHQMVVSVAVMTVAVVACTAVAGTGPGAGKAMAGLMLLLLLLQAMGHLPQVSSFMTKYPLTP